MRRILPVRLTWNTWHCSRDLVHRVLKQLVHIWCRQSMPKSYNKIRKFFCVQELLNYKRRKRGAKEESRMCREGTSSSLKCMILKVSTWMRRRTCVILKNLLRIKIAGPSIICDLLLPRISKLMYSVSTIEIVASFMSSRLRRKKLTIWSEYREICIFERSKCRIRL